jgi:cytochrome P450 family 4
MLTLCLFVCFFLSFFLFSFFLSHTHVYVYIYIYIYIYIYMCVCVCVCMCVSLSPCLYAAHYITNLSFCTTYRTSQQHSVLRIFAVSGFKSRSLYSRCK